MNYTELALEGFSYCFEMFMAACCFLVFLEKRKKFIFRIGFCLVILFFCSLLFYPHFANIKNQYNWIWYIGIYTCIIGLNMFCCNITAREAVLAASCGSFLQHAVSSFYILIHYRGIIPEFMTVDYWCLYGFIYLVTALAIARNLSDGGHYHVSWMNAGGMAVIDIDYYK